MDIGSLLRKWLRLNIGIKRWLLLFIFGVIAIAFALSLSLYPIIANSAAHNQSLLWIAAFLLAGAGFTLVIYAILYLSRSILAPYQHLRKGDLIDEVVEHRSRNRGLRIVAIGGGTGLPATLHGLKQYTSNITAIVTVADDGGSSGRLRRDLGVLPPGDIRNNIAALADDDSLLTHLFQYRFSTGDLSGHAFGNLLIAAMAYVVQTTKGQHQNALAEALVEIERILNIRGRVLPTSLADITLVANVKLDGSGRIIRVRGESQIEKIQGRVQSIALEPSDVEAYPDGVQAILDADVVVIGPGSLYTSILPSLMVQGIADALRATSAYKIYVCNVATQPVETTDYTVAEHVLALEKHIGRGVFQAVLANNSYPEHNRGITQYVPPAPEHHEILQRYEVRYTDLADEERPWRHDSQKLSGAIMELYWPEQSSTKNILSGAIISLN